MAKLANRATSTIQAIELGRLPLIESLGQQIARETGVNLQWLLDGDATKPIIDASGKPYTLAAFEQRQAWINRRLGEYPDDLRWTQLSITMFLQLYCGLAISALKTGRFTLFNYKMCKIWPIIAEDFGDKHGVGFTYDGPIPSKHMADLSPVAVAMVRELYKTAKSEIKSKNKT
jgi:hypothetical protein